MVLEEFLKTDAVLLDNLFDFHHEVIVSLDTIKVSESVLESGLGACRRSIDDVLQAVSGTEELVVLNVVLLVAVDKSDGVDLLLIDLESEGVQDLAEDFGGHFEGSVSVVILEEALSIESVLADNLTESVNH